MVDVKSSASSLLVEIGNIVIAPRAREIRLLSSVAVVFQ